VHRQIESATSVSSLGGTLDLKLASDIELRRTVANFPGSLDCGGGDPTITHYAQLENTRSMLFGS